MIIGEWYENTNFNNNAIKGTVTLLDECAKIELDGKSYKMAYISCAIHDFASDKFIDLSIDLTEIKNKNKFYASWYKNNTEIFKEYIGEDFRIRPYEDADELIVSFLVFGEEKDVICISAIKANQSEKIIDRKVCVASIANDYGLVCEHPYRTPEDNVNDSIRKLDALCNHLKTDIIVFTESFISRNISTVAYSDRFLPIDHEYIKRMRAKAAEYKTYISFAFCEKTKEGYFSNTALLIDRKGDIAGYYRKSHLTMGELIGGIIPGNEIKTFDTDFGKIAIAVCYDLFFTEFVRKVSAEGVDIIINPSAGYDHNMHCERAAESGAYVVTSGVWGNTTVVISPEGKIIADGCLDGVAYAELDLNKRYPVKYLSSGSSSERANVYNNEMRTELYL